MNTLQQHLQPPTSTEPATQIQVELNELRGVTGELEQHVADLWARLGTVVLPTAGGDKNLTTPVKEGVPLANELREIVVRLVQITGSIRTLRQAIQL